MDVIRLGAKILIGGIMMGLWSCGGGKELPTVKSLDLEKYSGKWYEIAKLPNSFEKNLKCISATYSIKEDGSIGVFNRGLDVSKSNKVDEIEGSAKVPDPSKPGEIKVTFFWPFYGDYFVFYLDKDYTTALVGSPSRKYFWLLHRNQSLSQDEYDRLIQLATNQGFDPTKIEKTLQDCPQ